MAAHFSLLTTDASKSRWGTIFDSNQTNGRRSISKSLEKVNVRELNPIAYGILRLSQLRERDFYPISQKTMVKLFDWLEIWYT